MAIGALIGAWWLARAIQSLQYGVTATDPATWLTVVAVIAVTSLAAVWRPATRADPALLLRDE